MTRLSIWLLRNLRLKWFLAIVLLVPVARPVCADIYRFVDEDGVLEVLAKVAKSDKNVDVRKKAIYVLGRSEDPKVVKILKDIAER